MKKAIVMILLSAIILTMLSACMPNSPSGENKGEAAGSNNANGATNNLVSETHIVSPTKTLNSELISDIGLTYTQLTEKYGNLVDGFTISAGLSYVFSNGYGEYGWGFDNLDADDTFSIASDGGKLILESAPLPKTQEKCYSVRTTPSQLFLGMEKALTISEIKEIYGINEPIVTTSADGYDGWSYTSQFSHENIAFLINTHEKDTVGLDSEVSVFSNYQPWQ